MIGNTIDYCLFSKIDGGLLEDRWDSIVMLSKRKIDNTIDVVFLRRSLEARWKIVGILLLCD